MTQFNLFDSVQPEKKKHTPFDGDAQNFDCPKLSEITLRAMPQSSASPVGMALRLSKNAGCYIPLKHKIGQNAPDTLPIIKALCESEETAKIGHDIKNMMLSLRNLNIGMMGQLYDIMLASYLLNPNLSDHNLENICLEHMMIKKTSLADQFGKTPFTDISVENATEFSCHESGLILELKTILFNKLEEDGLASLYFDLEMPLIYVLSDMQNRGVKVDLEKTTAISKELEKELDGLQSKIFALAGEEFNINSPKQLARILFDVIGLRPTKKTKTGFSTNMEVLEELAKAHELPQEIINYRGLHKLKTTYIDAFPQLVRPETGRIHTTLNQTVTATGRLSSSDPNLQNIPVRGEWGPRIRGLFVAEEGNLLLSADYSQIELRVLAHLSGDETLINTFRNNEDIHTHTAREIFGVNSSEVTPDMRRAAKTINFGIVYGMSPFGLSEALGISPKEAGMFIDSYFNRHKGVREYFDKIIEAARQNGFVTTLMNRKRQISDINSSNANLRQQAERLAMNSPIQGTAADLIKKAMLNVWNRLRQEKLRSVLILQIHDELLLEVPENEAEQARKIVTDEMENAIQISVPIKVEAGIGRSWADAH
ncbi:MAG: DNA polymerase I [Dissulfurispiraceae bacterium]|jgi:DNA polymerase-1|nr:DNA polymerase I [Dissulfurispiraceae bacterium]